MTDSKTAKKIEVIPCICGHDRSKHDIEQPYECLVTDANDACQCDGFEYPKLSATELVEPSARPQCSCDCPNYDSSCPVHGTPKHIAGRAVASSPAAPRTLSEALNRGCTPEPAARVEQPTPQPHPDWWMCDECGAETADTNYHYWATKHEKYTRHQPLMPAPAAPVVEQRELVKACATIARSVIANGVIHTYSPAAGWCCEEGYKAFEAQRTEGEGQHE